MAEDFDKELYALFKYYGSTTSVPQGHRTDMQLQFIQDRCNSLFSRDYIISLFDNNLCQTYPLQIVLMHGTITQTPRRNNRQGVNLDTNDPVGSATLIEEQMRLSQDTRARQRFVVPVLRVGDRYIARSAGLTEKAELMYRTAMRQNWKGIIQGALKPKKSSARETDIAWMKLLRISHIVDLMNESVRSLLGVPLASGESASRYYSDFKVNSMPFPGVATYQNFIENRKQNLPLPRRHNSDSSSLPTLSLAHPCTLPPPMNWSDLGQWNIVTLMQNYIRYILYLCRTADSKEGLLIHCISVWDEFARMNSLTAGWDRTPLFVGVLRILLWAEGEAHASLSVDQILYLVVAYDWMLFGFWILQHLASSDFSLNLQKQPLHSAQDSPLVVDHHPKQQKRRSSKSKQLRRLSKSSEPSSLRPPVPPPASTIPPTPSIAAPASSSSSSFSTYEVNKELDQFAHLHHHRLTHENDREGDEEAESDLEPRTTYSNGLQQLNPDEKNDRIEEPSHQDDFDENTADSSNAANRRRRYAHFLDKSNATIFTRKMNDPRQLHESQEDPRGSLDKMNVGDTTLAHQSKSRDDNDFSTPIVMSKLTGQSHGKQNDDSSFVEASVTSASDKTELDPSLEHNPDDDEGDNSFEEEEDFGVEAPTPLPLLHRYHDNYFDDDHDDDDPLVDADNSESEGDSSPLPIRSQSSNPSALSPTLSLPTSLSSPTSPLSPRFSSSPSSTSSRTSHSPSGTPLSPSPRSPASLSLVPESGDSAQTSSSVNSAPSPPNISQLSSHPSFTSSASAAPPSPSSRSGSSTPSAQSPTPSSSPPSSSSPRRRSSSPRQPPSSLLSSRPSSRPSSPRRKVSSPPATNVPLTPPSSSPPLSPAAPPSPTVPVSPSSRSAAPSPSVAAVESRRRKERKYRLRLIYKKFQELYFATINH